MISTATSVESSESAPHVWSDEPSKTPNRRRIRARIGGLHCSLCTGTIEKALGGQPGVEKVAVSLTHEQALIEYDPGVAQPVELLQTLKYIGCTISDPRKLRPFEEEESALVRERGRISWPRWRRASQRWAWSHIHSAARGLRSACFPSPASWRFRSWSCGATAFVPVSSARRFSPYSAVGLTRSNCAEYSVEQRRGLPGARTSPHLRNWTSHL